jgi:hypothetical protein
VRLAAKYRELVVMFALGWRRPKDVVWDSGYDSAIGLEIDLLGFRLKTLDDWLWNSENQMRGNNHRLYIIQDLQGI